jgi:hypothetical protein
MTNWGTEHSKGNKTVPAKVATTRTVGWTQIDYRNRHCIIDQKNEVTWDDLERDGRTNCGTEHSKGTKTVTAKVATARTEDGHKQTIKTGTALSTKRTKKPGTTEEEMEGPTSP